MSQNPEKIQHISSKEERDAILEYNSIDLSSLTKETICSIPFDNVSIDEAVAKIKKILDSDSKKPHHVLLLDPIKAMYFRQKGKYHEIAQNADMIIAAGAGLRWASRLAGKPLKERISTIALVMDLVRLSEMKNYTLFFYGGSEGVIEKVYFNLTRHFPKIRIVGRHAGHSNPERERMVKESMRKTSPHIIFIANDHIKQEIWINSNREYFGNAVVIGVGNTLDLLSGRVKVAPDWFKTRGLIWLWKLVTQPWKINRVLRFIQFVILAIVQKFKKS